MQKRTRLLTNDCDVVVRFAPFRCRCATPHHPIQGSVGGVKLSEYAAHYPPVMCEQLAHIAAQLAQDMP